MRACSTMLILMSMQGCGTSACTTFSLRAHLLIMRGALLMCVQEQLEVLQGLQGLQLDARGVASAGTFELTLRGQFRIHVQLPRGEEVEAARGGEGAAAAVGTCAVRAEMLAAFIGGGGSPCSEALLPIIGVWGGGGGLWREVGCLG